MLEAVPCFMVDRNLNPIAAPHLPSPSSVPHGAGRVLLETAGGRVVRQGGHDDIQEDLGSFAVLGWTGVRFFPP